MKNIDKPGCNKYFMANSVQGYNLQYPPSFPQLFVDLDQEFQTLAIDKGHALAVQDNLGFVLIDTLIKRGF
jgi:hypothetical protein